jgi:hypothetical protein
MMVRLLLYALSLTKHVCKLTNTYKCVFPGHQALDTWYPSDDTQNMAKAYLEHQAATKATSKRKSHVIDLKEACAMVGRVSARPAPYANATSPTARRRTDANAAGSQLSVTSKDYEVT